MTYRCDAFHDQQFQIDSLSVWKSLHVKTKILWTVEKKTAMLSRRRQKSDILRQREKKV